MKVNLGLSKFILIPLLFLTACGEAPEPKFRRNTVVIIITDTEKITGSVREIHCGNGWRVGHCVYKVRFGHADLSEWIWEEELEIKE